jgi:hypothetical protein
VRPEDVDPRAVSEAVEVVAVESELRAHGPVYAADRALHASM